MDTRTLMPYGNSTVVSLPKEWLKARGLKNGSKVDWDYSEDFKEIRFRKSE